MGSVWEPLSYTRRAPTRAAGDGGAMHVDSRKLAVTTPFWEIRFHPDGGLSSLKDRRTGAEFLRPEAPRGLFAGKIDGQDTDLQGTLVAGSGTPAGLGPLPAQSGLIGTIPYTLEMKFYPESPRIDCWMRFRFSGREDRTCHQGRTRLGLRIRP